MKCLHVPHAYPPAIGGAELICQRVSEDLAEQGHQVRVLTSNVGAVQAYFELGVHAVGPSRERRNGVHVRRLGYIGPIYRVAGCVARLASRAGMKGVATAERLQAHTLYLLQRLLTARIRVDINRYRPDVIVAMPHLLANVSAVVELNQKLGYPLVLVPMLHEHDPLWPAQAMRAALAEADAVIALTRCEAQRLIDRYGVPDQAVVVASVGIDAPPARGAPDRRPRVLFLGRMVISKGVIDLIDAMEQVWQLYPQAELVLAGSRVAESERIDSRLKALPATTRSQVSALGPVTGAEKASLIASCRLLVLPSQIESFGMVLLEAWCAGLPVVTWDLPVFRDIVDHRQDGILVEPGNTKAMAQSIAALLGDYDEAARLGAAGFDKARQQHRWDQVAKHYLDAYEFAVEHRNESHKLNKNKTLTH